MAAENVIEFTGGKRCKDCEFQIEPDRVKHNPDAKRCVSCQHEYEKRVTRELGAMRSPRCFGVDNEIVVIKR